jgi:hypothetical protein
MFYKFIGREGSSSGIDRQRSKFAGMRKCVA